MTINSNKQFRKQYQALPPKSRLQFQKRVELLQVNPNHPLLSKHIINTQIGTQVCVENKLNFQNQAPNWKKGTVNIQSLYIFTTYFPKIAYILYLKVR